MSVRDLGVGIVYVPGIEPLLEPGNGLVQVLEIEPQTLWHATPGPADQRDRPPEATPVPTDAAGFPIARCVCCAAFRIRS